MHFVVGASLIHLGLLKLLLLSLLYLRQLNLPQYSILVFVDVPTFHPFPHPLHLTLLFFLQNFIHSLQLLLVLVEQHVNIVLIHVLQQVTLLVSEFPSHDLLFLSPKLLHVVLIAFLLLLPAVHALLSVLQLYHLSFLGFLKMFSFSNLFLISFATELLQLLLAVPK